MKTDRVLFLTNNQNTESLYRWLTARVSTDIYSGALTEDMLKERQFSLIISYNYSHIIPANIIDFIGENIINLHISYLPWNRGAHPNLWSFLENTPKGVTIHRLEKGLDTGAIIFQKEMFFDENKETLASSYQKLNEELVKLFRKHWEKLFSGNYQEMPQEGKGSYHSLADMKKLLQRKNLERLDWNMTVEEFKKLMAGEIIHECKG